MSLSIEEVNEIKRAPDVASVLPVFHTRWSPRSFTDRAVSPADLAKVFEAARWAASSFNEQPWRYFVGYEGSETYQKIFTTLAPFNQVWVPAAPVLIAGVARTRFSHNESPNRFGLYDLGAATACLTLQAAALGIATHQMGGFDPEALLKAFEAPAEYVCGSVMALGYQGEPDALPNEQFRAQEVAPRTRKALGEFVFSAWDTPADLG